MNIFYWAYLIALISACPAIVIGSCQSPFENLAVELEQHGSSGIGTRGSRLMDK